MNQINLLEGVQNALLVISNTQGTNAKLDQAQLVKDTPMLKEIVFMTYSNSYNFFVRKLPEPSSGLLSSIYEDQPKALLEAMSSRDVTGNAALADVSAMLYKLHTESPLAETLFRNILARDLKTGLSVKGWNKVFGADFIDEVPCMKAREQNEKTLANILYPAFAQIKYDGTRLITQVKNGELLTRSRNGSKFYFIEQLRASIESILPDTTLMIDGELVFRDKSTGKLLDRKKSNGLATQCIKGVNPYDSDLYEPVYLVWDFVIEGENLPYIKRFKELELMVNLADSNIILAESHVVHSLDQAKAIYTKYLEKGEEGIILKNIDAQWENKRSNNLVKFKDEFEVDLRIIGWELGKPNSQFKNTVGNLICESDDGTIKTSVGSGFAPELRDHIRDNWSDYADQVVTLKCNALILAKKSTVHSLFLPVYVGLRADKNETNSAGDF